MHYLLSIIGFLTIIIASDILVDAAKSVAIRFKVPKMLIALTIVAFGTCAPELAISFKSVASNNGSIALANVLGSCIVNTLLVIGLASLAHPIKIKNQTIKKELPLLVFITTAFILLLANGILSQSKEMYVSVFDGLILLLFFTVFIAYIIKLVRKKDRSKSNEQPKYGLMKSILYLIITIAVVSYSADLLINNVIIIAEELGISEKIITMTAIVIGTSLPELFLTIASARKNEHEMAVGNIIGTNIFNICIVLGLPMTIFNGFRIVSFNLIDLSVVLIATLLIYFFARSEKTISKKEGFILIGTFLLYYVYILF